MTAPDTPHLRPRSRAEQRARIWLRLSLSFTFLIGSVAYLVIRPDRVLLSLLMIGVALPIIPLGLWFIVARILLRRRLVGLLRENEEAVALLGDGRADEAATVLERLTRQASQVPNFHALLVHNLGVALMARGQLDSARTLIARALDSGWLDGKDIAHPGALFRLSLTVAETLRGDLDAARAALELAEPEVPPSRRGALLLPRVLLSARSGDHQRAAIMSDSDWRDAEQLTPLQRRALHIVHAFALEHSDGSGERVAQALAAAPRVRRGELDYLGTRWSELDDFLQRHALRGAGVSDAELSAPPPLPG